MTNSDSYDGEILKQLHNPIYDGRALAESAPERVQGPRHYEGIVHTYDYPNISVKKTQSKGRHGVDNRESMLHSHIVAMTSHQNASLFGRKCGRYFTLRTDG